MTELEAVAFVNLGRWAAYCPAPYCGGAEHFGVQPTGLGPVRGGLALDVFACIQGCQRVFPARWPDGEMRAGVERLLGLRPDWRNRNWAPPETLSDLLLENAEHGIGLPALPERTGTVLAIVGDRIVTGAEALTAARPLAIGGR